MSGLAAAPDWLPAAVTGLCLGVGIALVRAGLAARRPSLARRLAELRPARDGASGWDLVRAPWLRLVESLGSTGESVQRRLRLAGKPGELAAFRLQQVAWALACAGLASLAGASGRASGGPLAVLVVLGTLAGAVGRDQLLTARAGARQRRLDQQVPDACDLMALAVRAGESVPGAIERTAAVSRSDLAGELREVLEEIRRGSSTTQALAQLADGVEAPALRRLCATLVSAIERGSPLAAVLHAQARDIREDARRRLLEEGGKREIGMLVPVVFLILPITVLFALYPGMFALQIG